MSQACDISAGEIAKLVFASALSVAVIAAWTARDGWLALVTFTAVAGAGVFFDRIDKNMCMVNEPLHLANTVGGYFHATVTWYFGVIASSCVIGSLLGKTQGWWFSPWFYRFARSKAVEKAN
ncbi:MAG: hypothetical protein M3Y55_06110 [Pseudomonadota bacterium]|nr:hypothetical protein [Pseudomonadota bacterium]